MQQAMDHSHHHSRTDSGGMVMNENLDQLPRDCSEISEEISIEINAGTEFARDFPESTFTFDSRELVVPPCSRVMVTFNNKDSVRHQWMLHGLPRYLYPGGMFHLEANGGEMVSGGFIVPSDNQTYLVHCDLPQHMEKGMKAQLKVGSGNGDLWSIPGTSAHPKSEDYLEVSAFAWLGAAVFAGFLAARLFFKN